MRAFIDRIEDGIATLLLGEDESAVIELPMIWLPTGSQEGAVLSIEIRLDTQSTEQSKHDVTRLMEELGDNP